MIQKINITVSVDRFFNISQEKNLAYTSLTVRTIVLANLQLFFKLFEKQVWLKLDKWSNHYSSINCEDKHSINLTIWRLWLVKINIQLT